MSQLSVLLSVVLGFVAIVGMIGRALVLLGRVVRTHQRLVADVATLILDRPKVRHRLKRIETELGLRPRGRTTTITTSTTESEPLPT